MITGKAQGTLKKQKTIKKKQRKANVPKRAKKQSRIDETQTEPSQL